MIITYASEEDQQAILDLEQVIFNDMELAVYDELTVTEVQNAWQIAVRQSDKSRYHYSRAIVAKDNEGLLLGVLFGYPDTDEPILDEAVQNVLADKYSYHGAKIRYPNWTYNVCFRCGCVVTIISLH